MEHHYRRFVEFIKLRNLSPATLEAYTGSVQRYFRFCRDHKVSADSTAAARTYLLHLKEERQLSPSSINVAYSGLKLYFNKGEVADWDIEALPRQRRPRALPYVLSREQIAVLFEATPRLKYLAALMLSYSAGLRRAEVTHLRIEDIDSVNMRILVRHAKGSKQRYVMLSERLLETLRDYWREERPRTWLFPGDKKPDQPMCGDTLSRAFRMSRDAAGLPDRAKLHSLRHSFATHLLEKQTPLPFIQRLLGHSSLQSTLVYLRVFNASGTVKSPLDDFSLFQPDLEIV